MTTRTITDQQVAALPIHRGRAELLEEIMSTPVDQLDHVERVSHDRSQRRGRRALAVVAAVAAVAATVGGLAAWRIPHGAPAAPERPSYAGQSVAPHHTKHDGPKIRSTGTIPPVSDGRYFALDVVGWSLTNVDETGPDMGVNYARDGLEVELDLYPAESHQMYVRDREGDGHGTPISLLGQDATLWTPAPGVHDLIRTAEGDRFLEVTGRGMSTAAFLELVDRLVQTDARGFAGSLPADVVTPYNRMEAIRHLLRGVQTPPGFTADDVTLTGFNDAYQSAAQVAGSVGCAWLDVWDGGTEADRQAVIAAFDGSRSWPLLQRIADEGGYSHVFWGVAHRLRAGHTDKGGALTAAYLKSGICY
jgi:hypothetical protein